MVTAVAAFGPLVLMLWVFSVGDVLATPSADVRRWSRSRWLVATALLPGVGALAWIVAARPVARTRRGAGDRGAARRFADYDIRELTATMSPEEHDALRQACRQRAHEQRRRYAEQRRAARGTDRTDGDN